MLPPEEPTRLTEAALHRAGRRHAGLVVGAFADTARPVDRPAMRLLRQLVTATAPGPGTPAAHRAAGPSAESSRSATRRTAPTGHRPLHPLPTEEAPR